MKPTPEQQAALRLPPLSRRMVVFSVVLFFLLGAGLTALLFLSGSVEEGGEVRSTHDHQRGRAMDAEPAGEVFYQCPMHPHVIEPEPGRCPICEMELQPVVGGMDSPAAGQASSGEHAGVLRIDPVQVQNIGVVSTPARVGRI